MISESEDMFKSGTGLYKKQKKISVLHINENVRETINNIINTVRYLFVRSFERPYVRHVLHDTLFHSGASHYPR